MNNMTKEKNNKVPFLKVEELRLPPAPARAPQIDWGPDFEEWDDSHKIRYLKKLCSALNHAADTIHKERNETLKKCNELANLANNADKATEIQKTITRNALDSFNTEKQELIRRIKELEINLKNTNIQLKSTQSRLAKYED